MKKPKLVKGIIIKKDWVHIEQARKNWVRTEDGDVIAKNFNTFLDLPPGLPVFLKLKQDGYHIVNIDWARVI